MVVPIFKKPQKSFLMSFKVGWKLARKAPELSSGIFLKVEKHSANFKTFSFVKWKKGQRNKRKARSARRIDFVYILH